MPQQAPQDLSGGLRDLKTPEILRERVDYAYRRIVPLAGATVVLSLILSAFLWRWHTHGTVVFWQVVMLLLAAGLAGLAWSRRRAADAAQHPGLWARRLAIPARGLRGGT